MTHSMIEKAKTAVLAVITAEELSDDDFTEALVRAVLTAIREPNEAMLKAGGGDDPYSYGHTAAERWSAQIEAILKEGT